MTSEADKKFFYLHPGDLVRFRRGSSPRTPAGHSWDRHVFLVTSVANSANVVAIPLEAPRGTIMRRDHGQTIIPTPSTDIQRVISPNALAKLLNTPVENLQARLTQLMPPPPTTIYDISTMSTPSAPPASIPIEASL